MRFDRLERVMSLFDDIGALVSAQNRSFGALLDQAALNPQPLPPKDALGSALAMPADEVTLNPQPLPPAAMLTVLKDFDTAGLNPQPLPPKDDSGFVDAIAGVLERAVAPVQPLTIYEGVRLLEPWSDELSALQDVPLDPQDVPLDLDLTESTEHADEASARSGAGNAAAFETFQSTEVAVQETSEGY